jgi:hypothetical protein
VPTVCQSGSRLPGGRQPANDIGVTVP